MYCKQGFIYKNKNLKMNPGGMKSEILQSSWEETKARTIISSAGCEARDKSLLMFCKGRKHDRDKVEKRLKMHLENAEKKKKV